MGIEKKKTNIVSRVAVSVIVLAMSAMLYWILGFFVSNLFIKIFVTVIIGIEFMPIIALKFET
jgi:hypothetical protein